jgi:hypothetical protein
MKRYLLVIVVVFTSFNLIQAQGDVRFGVTLNPGLSWYKPDNQSHKSDGVRFAFTYGLVVDYKFGNDERYAINTGLQVGMAGGRISSTGIAEPVEEEVVRIFEEIPTSTALIAAKVQYLELPISIKLRSNETNTGLVYYGQLGFINGFSFRRRADHTVDDVKTTNVKLKDLEFYPQNIEKVIPYHLGMLIEAGIEYGISDNTAVVGGFFFNNGFTNVLKNGTGDRVVMRSFGLRMGVIF